MAAAFQSPGRRLGDRVKYSELTSSSPPLPLSRGNIRLLFPNPVLLHIWESGTGTRGTAVPSRCPLGAVVADEPPPASGLSFLRRTSGRGGGRCLEEARLLVSGLGSGFWLWLSTSPPVNRDNYLSFPTCQIVCWEG